MEDSLAVGIGTAHGFYQGKPQIHFDRLDEVNRAIDTPLVLHGGTGIPEEDIRRAISLGIAKVNVASELCKSLKDHLTKQWASGTPRWLPEGLKA